MTTLATDSLKLPAISVPRGRSPGSSPDVRRRSKEREQQRKLRTAPAGDQGFRLPRLFRGRSMSTTTTATYLARSLTNLSDITGAESPEDGGIELCASPVGQLRNNDSGKWPVMKTLSAASAKQQRQQHPCQNSASSTPGGRRSPKAASPHRTTPTCLTAPDGPKPRSQSHSHKFPLSFDFFRSKNECSERQTPFKNIHDSKGNWVGFVERNPSANGQAWSNKTTFLNRAKSADDVLQLFVDDLLET